MNVNSDNSIGNVEHWLMIDAVIYNDMILLYCRLTMIISSAKTKIKKLKVQRLILIRGDMYI